MSRLLQCRALHGGIHDGAEHLGFSDLGIVYEHFLPNFEGHDQTFGTIDATRLIAISRAYALTFFGKHLRGDAAPLLDEPSGRAPKDFPEITFTRKP